MAPKLMFEKIFIVLESTAAIAIYMRLLVKVFEICKASFILFSISDL